MKNQKNDPRTCDIDIIAFNEKQLNFFIKNNSIKIIHNRPIKHKLVLIQLFEINKNWIHPKLKHHIKRLILSLPNRDITSIKQF